MLKLAGWIIAVFIVAISAGEFWARERFANGSPWSSPQPLALPGEIVADHPSLGYQLKPNASAFFSGPNNEFDVNYQINEYGLRDSGMFSTGSKRPVVVVLGDSFVEGYGVMRDATFTLEMQRQLRFQPGATQYPRILSAGTSGFGATQSVVRGKDLIKNLKPALVIFAYTGLMPVADYRHKHGGSKTISINDSMTERANEDTSVLVRLFRDYWRTRKSQAAIKRGDPATDLFAATRSSAATSDLHRESLLQVAALAEYTIQHGAQFLLLHLPLPHQVAEDEWERGRLAFGFEEKIYEPPEAQLLNELCKSTMPSCLLTTPVLRSLAKERSSRLYFPTSYAMTESGHRAIVELLIGHVRTALNIPTPN